jgi:hypothetical protein
MLNKLSSATKPPAATAVILPLNNSWIIGEACSMIAMPAVTFMHNTIQSSQNCGVAKAALTSRCWSVTMAFGLTGATQPSGFHPSCGTRTVKTPNIIPTK